MNWIFGAVALSATAKFIYEYFSVIPIVKNYITLKIRKSLCDYFECGKVEYINGMYTITYFHNSTKYKHTFKSKRGSLGIMSVIDTNNTNITSSFLEFMGPGKNFHGTTPTPNDLGYTTAITIKYVGNKVKTFALDNVIVL